MPTEMPLVARSLASADHLTNGYRHILRRNLLQVLVMGSLGWASLGCFHRQPEPGSPAAAVTEVTPNAAVVQETAKAQSENLPAEDVRDLEIVLSDLLEWEESVLAFDPADKTMVVLDAKTVEKSGMLSDSQIRSERRHDGLTIPDDVLVNLRRRNSGSVDLRGFGPPSVNIVVRDLDEVEKAFDRDIEFQIEFQNRYPRARCYAHIWLPGYSEDGELAVLRFWIGPSAHGATGTYFLIREAGKWRVKWRRIAFYV